MRFAGALLWIIIAVSASDAFAQNSKSLDAAVGDCMDANASSGAFFAVDPSGAFNVRASGMRLIVSCEKQFSAWLNDCEKNTGKSEGCTSMGTRIAQTIVKNAWENRDRAPAAPGVSIPTGTPAECSTTINTHGLLSRAQFQCGFRSYSQAMMDAAKKCSAVLSEADVMAALKAGMTKFDSSEQKFGHDAFCADILTNFPNFVRR